MAAQEVMNMFGFFRWRGLSASIFFMLVSATVAYGEEADSFGWSITPYLWATETSVDLTFQDADIGAGEISFRDLLDILDAAFMIHVEGGRGNWTAFGDLTYLKTSDSTERTAFVVDTNSKQLFIDGAVAWWPGGAGSNFNLYGGFRHSGFDDRYTFRLIINNAPVGERRSTKDYYDALVGLRYRFDLSERWSLLTRADTSFGDSEGTVLLQANLAWTVGKRQQNRILFGYQYKTAEFRDDDLRLDFDYQGPMAGFNFRF
jgi:hypothetical protein